MIKKGKLMEYEIIKEQINAELQNKKQTINC
ncbi:Hypothetical protein CFV354_1902 [Campylobacter fetus subsp. venerealis NCTC 10354]|nr:Hypothetical protein CFV354_1902 [Campylobacter fetus subsp. venerealis NCTC 10354]